MVWVNFLHIYQPANQTKNIFDRVVSESYRPLVKILIDNPGTKLTLNINAVLTERIGKEYPDLLEKIRFVSERGQVEFTDSAKYHTLLPFLPEDEIERQITLNNQTNKRLIGESYNPKGFFPPEMAYSPTILPVLERLGYKWLIIDEIALNGRLGQMDKNVIYTVDNSNMEVYFRERGPSNLIMSAMARQEKDLKYFLRDEYGKRDYMITGMDGETFGHHRPGLDLLLKELLLSDQFEHLFVAELSQKFADRKKVSPVVSTWASSQKDIEDGVQFISWNEPNNEIQKLQWELQQLVLNTVKSCKNPGISREKLDMALASDQFFWSSGRPWWSHEAIELGAWQLLDALKEVPNVDLLVLEKANSLYVKILLTTFEWQRTGKVQSLSRQMKEETKISFKDKTTREPWVYNAFLSLMKDLMNKASDKANFEEAILWRDAIWKLETKNDIFDAVHAVDLLRIQIPNTEILNVIEKYRQEYLRTVSGQPEQRR